MRRGKLLENITIEALWYGGVWIATHEDGKKILIKWWLPGSVVDCKIIKKKKDYYECHITAVRSVDGWLVDGSARCPHYMSPYKDDQSDSSVNLPEWKKWCGWCKWQWISYEKQCALKEEIVHDALKVIWTDRFEFHPIVPSPLEYGYRNKIEFSFGKFLTRYPIQEDKSRKEWFAIEQHWNAWFHKQGEFSKVVDIDQCYLVSEKMHEVYQRLKHELKESWLPVYDAKKHTGVLRHLVMREGVRTGQLLVNISHASNYFHDNVEHRRLWEALIDSWKADEELTSIVTTLVLTHNNGLWDNVQWPEAYLETVRWDGHIYEGLQFEWADLVTFQVSPFSFFQTNTHGAEVLFGNAKKILWNVEGNIIDLYCGSGSIGLSFMHQWVGRHVHGIDIVPSAIKDAKENAKRNWMDHKATFHCGKAEVLLKEWVINDQCFVWKDVIIIDPPRQWVHKDVVTFLCEMKKRYPDHKLLYISCNPVTMARDITWLIAWGYTLDCVQPVDMFPHTHHIEVIWLLQ